MKSFKSHIKTIKPVGQEDNDLDQHTDAVGRRVEVDFPGNSRHNQRGEVESSNESGTFHTVKFDDGHTAHYHGSDLKFARHTDNDVNESHDSVKVSDLTKHYKLDEALSNEDEVEKNLRLYHAHNLIAATHELIGLDDIAAKHFRLANGYHSQANAIAANYPMNENFSAKKKRIKSEVHSEIQDNLL